MIVSVPYLHGEILKLFILELLQHFQLTQLLLAQDVILARLRGVVVGRNHFGGCGRHYDAVDDELAHAGQRLLLRRGRRGGFLRDLARGGRVLLFD